MGFTPGPGGGSSSIGGSTDVSLTGVQDEDVLTYDSTSAKWLNQALTGHTGVTIHGILNPGDTPPHPGVWLRRDVAVIDGLELVHAGSYASSGDVASGQITMSQGAGIGDVLLVSVHASGNTATLGCSDAAANSYTASIDSATTGSTPHMKARIFRTVVTTPLPAGQSITVTRSNAGGLVGHVAIIRGVSGSIGSQAIDEGSSNPINLTSISADANSVVVSAVTTQANQDIGTGGIGGGFTLGANMGSTGGSGQRRGILIYRIVPNATNVTGSITMQGASVWCASSMVLS